MKDAKNKLIFRETELLKQLAKQFIFLKPIVFKSFTLLLEDF